MTFMQSVQQELLHQRGLVNQLIDEIPALRMELAVLRADMQALEDRLACEVRLVAKAPIIDEVSHRRFIRAHVDLQQEPRPHSPEQQKYYDSPHSQLVSRPNRVNFDPRNQDESEEPEDLETPVAVSLEPNIWDCAMMIALHGWNVGREIFGRFNVIVTIIMLLANTIIQGLFVFAVKSMVETNPFEDDAMLNMRLQDGHIYANMDHKTMQTKAQQTCNLQAYNMLGETVNWVTDYLMVGTETQSVLPGSIICTLSMLTWTVSIFSEVRRSMQDLVLVVLSLPPTSTVVVRQHGETMVIEGVTRVNKAISTLVMVPRCAIAAALLWYGMMFLAGTIELRELLTNAVALEFVQSIDEMLFEAIMPRKLMSFVKAIKIRVFKGCLPHEHVGGKLNRSGYHAPANWRVPGMAKQKGLGVQTCYVMLRIITISASIVGGYILFIKPTIGYTQNAYNELCGQYTNFTWMLHPMTRVPIFANLDPYTEFSAHDKGRNTLRCFYAAQYEMLRMRAGFPGQYNTGVNETLMTLVNGTHPLCWPKDGGFMTPSPLVCPEQSLGYFNWMAVASEDQYYEDPYYCRDQDVFMAVLRDTCLNETFFRDSPGDLAFFEDVWSCRDFTARCHNTTRHGLKLTWVWQIQKLCPETCGSCMTPAMNVPDVVPTGMPTLAAPADGVPWLPRAA